MSIYNENSTLFMNKAERDSAIYEAETEIIPGYTSTIDFFKIIEGAYANDMAIFEAMFNSDVEEIKYKSILLTESSDKEKISATVGIKEENSKKINKLKEISIAAIEKLSKLWASILDSIDKAFIKVQKQILVGGRKKFETSKEEYIAKDLSGFVPSGTFYDNINFSNIQNRIDIIKTALDIINIDTIEKMIPMITSENDYEKVVLDTFVKDLGTGNDIDKDVKSFDKYRDALSLTPSKSFVFDKDEVLLNIENFLKTDDSIHQLKNTVYTKLKNLKRDLAANYRNNDDENSVEKLNKLNKLINTIRTHFSYRFNALFDAKKKALTQAYTLFNQGLRYKTKDAVNTESAFEDLEIINLIEEI